ncbi:MAG: PEPxxWA-CTERM sorting domain-containing protein, partial [Sphingomicrobium sp.]
GSDLTALSNLLAGAGGQVLLGLHWGNVPDSGNPSYGNVSAFYLWDSADVGSINLTNTQGYSNAVLYQGAIAAVPEPSTWAMMLIGFGGVGVAMRRRRRTGAQFAQAA